MDGITFGSPKKKVVKVTLSDEPHRARGKDQITSTIEKMKPYQDEVNKSYAEMNSMIQREAMFGKTKAIDTKKVEERLEGELEESIEKRTVHTGKGESSRMTIMSFGDLDEIRKSTPEQLFDETSIKGYIVYKMSETSIAVRNQETKMCKYYQYRDGKWINRFNTKEEL